MLKMKVATNNQLSIYNQNLPCKTGNLFNK
jgi:hypothetical protein